MNNWLRFVIVLVVTLLVTLALAFLLFVLQVRYARPIEAIADALPAGYVLGILVGIGDQIVLALRGSHRNP
jgi:hypothetical protein